VAAVRRVRSSLRGLSSSSSNYSRLLSSLSSRDVVCDASQAGHLPRDALLAGIKSALGDFDDPAFVDLLAEAPAPQWLACMGALCQIWPVSAANGCVLMLPLPAVPEDDQERGLQFWHCLQRVVSGAPDDMVAVEARKRMKLLDSGLHARIEFHSPLEGRSICSFTSPAGEIRARSVRRSGKSSRSRHTPRRSSADRRREAGGPHVCLRQRLRQRRVSDGQIERLRAFAQRANPDRNGR